ncbi:MAG: UDP-N-acetylmuramoyl-L-alanyl-D-glutamate--2,6-diaminopimelate ligase [Thermoleophilia bacterium]
MDLIQLVDAVPGARLAGSRGATPPITGVAARADSAMPGQLFVCVPGVRMDGHDVAPQAVARGVSALVVERELPLDVPQVVVPSARQAVALIAARMAGNPAARLRVVGVTGTNGKTTCAYLVRAVLEAAGESCGLIGTVETLVGGRPDPATHTTPDPAGLHALFARMLEAGDTACSMEVSSHALHQHRVAGVPFAAAVFTNLTRDHLDYHRDLEDYVQAKRLLFARPAGDGPDPPGAANLDDPFGARLAGELGLLGYAIDAPADVRPRVFRQTQAGAWADVETPRGRLELDTRLRGRFNLANILAVVSVAELLGLPHHAVATGLGGVAGVPGRLEPVEAGQPFQVLVDYAHTPDSLQNVLQAARGLAEGGRVILVFGCGGDRDRGKRPQMGDIARRMADVAVVTSDNPRSEDPDEIIREIAAGAVTGPARMVVLPDRTEAIAAAVGMAEPGDIVLVAGKGHERGQEVAGVITPFDDREVARAVLEELAR